MAEEKTRVEHVSSGTPCDKGANGGRAIGPEARHYEDRPAITRPTKKEGK